MNGCEVARIVRGKGEEGREDFIVQVEQST